MGGEECLFRRVGGHSRVAQLNAKASLESASLSVHLGYHEQLYSEFYAGPFRRPFSLLKYFLSHQDQMFYSPFR